jgi:hypothetical protein
MIEIEVNIAPTMSGTGGFGLPQMSEREMFEKLLSEDSDYSDNEPVIAANIGEQMLHMDLIPLTRSFRVRIRDITSKIPAKNVVLVGGGIGHLAAWLLDLWTGDPANPPVEPRSRPESFRIIEPAGKFGVIIDRLIRRHSAEQWSQILTRPWQEITAETFSWSAATTALPSTAQPSPLPQPIDLIIIDTPEIDRPSATLAALQVVSIGGFILIKEPEVPTGDVGTPEDGQEPNEAQKKVNSFNQWMEIIHDCNIHHSMAFAELSGGTLAVIRRSI